MNQKQHLQELTPPMLLAAYGQGLFPMADSRHGNEVRWYCSDPRAVLPLERFHCPRSLRQRVRSGRFEIRMDSAFEQVVRHCSEPRPGHPETWINETIVRAYRRLHAVGHAHSVESWRDGRLVGGLYGVTLGGAFFGESMFSLPESGGTDASKVALVHLVEHLRKKGFVLLDAQINSPHLKQFGVIDLPLDRYLEKLSEALVVEAAW
ncbi:MAG: leucyl/phenylalanyl-tRNA--protein transferase [Phycisphaeraceae bacterium]|nr:leucyl/phenylalanyl-tRNA--protein transferase [Phycisphaeraceae bacterium]